MTRIPIFPLNTILFPGGPLPLRIFERRYLDMVSYCMRQQASFGVCLIKQGREDGALPVPHAVGTLATIVDWNQQPDGLLGIVALGGDRFRIVNAEADETRLLWAETERLPTPAGPRLPPQSAQLTRLIDQVMELENSGYEHCTRDDTDALWLSCRLAEVLPMSLDERQALLCLDDSMERLRAISKLIPDGLRF